MKISVDVLREHNALESVDHVSGSPEITSFKQRARLHQAMWRAENGLPIGSQPYRGNTPNTRPIGSRIAWETARSSGENFLSTQIRSVVEHRVTNKQPREMLNAYRLYADLLSSMPMCFNLFGSIAEKKAATQAVKAWWPDTPGEVSAVAFEWSPGRGEAGRYLGNGSAFDVAFILDLGGGKKGILGVETKYHEHCLASPLPRVEPERTREMRKREHYMRVAEDSKVFKPNACSQLIGGPLHQIWLDHLLVLSMLDADENWTWGRFCLVYPQANPSYSAAARAYEQTLADSASFRAVTLEQLLSACVLEDALAKAFRARYLWPDSNE